MKVLCEVKRSSVTQRWYALTVAAWVGTVALILLASFMPEQTPGFGNEIASSEWWNLGHIAAYGVLALLTTIVVINLYGVSVYHAMAAGVVVSAVGVFVELIQPLFGRTRNFYDFMFNEIGILVGAGIALMTLVYLRRKSVLR